VLRGRTGSGDRREKCRCYSGQDTVLYTDIGQQCQENASKRYIDCTHLVRFIGHVQRFGSGLVKDAPREFPEQVGAQQLMIKLTPRNQDMTKPLSASVVERALAHNVRNQDDKHRVTEPLRGSSVPGSVPSRKRGPEIASISPR